MPVFEYKALNHKGKKKAGILDAESLVSAGNRLREKSIFPISIKEIDAEATLTQGKSKGLLLDTLLLPRISSGEITVMTRQLSTLLSAGFPLVTAVSTLVPQTKSKPFQKVLSKVKGALEEGKSFAEALALYPSVFQPIYINMIKAGESSGTLEIVLERLADLTEKNQDTKKKIQATLAYPLFMSIIGSMVLFFLLTYVVPDIIDIFSDMKQTLPAPTLLLIAISSFFKQFWWMILLLPIAAGIMIFLLKKSEKGAYFIDKTLFFTPKVGSLIQKLATARFSRILASLLDNGVPMLTALGIARTITGNSLISRLITNAANSVEQGGELGEALSRGRAFPFLAVQMIKVGEKSGKLETMLEKTADLYEKEVESSVTAMSALLEPMIILVMGVITGFIVLSICLPIFEINQLVQ